MLPARGRTGILRRPPTHNDATLRQVLGALLLQVPAQPLRRLQHHQVVHAGGAWTHLAAQAGSACGGSTAPELSAELSAEPVSSVKAAPPPPAQSARRAAAVAVSVAGHRYSGKAAVPYAMG